MPLPHDGDSATLVTGGSGYLGSLVAAELLSERRRLVLPLRTLGGANECAARIQRALLDGGVEGAVVGELMRRLTLVELPALGELGRLDSVASSMRVTEIVHCAGCLDYFETRQLESANVELTSQWLEAARRWSLGRFYYLSSAYCAGYRSEPIAERLYPKPAAENEPTEYTRTKRTAEWLVADSDVPFVIVRPSIVIGDSRSGNYSGKNYGLYQMWRAWEALLGRDYSPIWYIVAPRVPVNFVHQDAFVSGFMGIYHDVQLGAIVHLVSDQATSPTMRDICWMWASVYCPREIRCYASIDDVPFESLPTRQRRFLGLVAKNLEIATHPWSFESTHLDTMRARGLSFTDATASTVARCQQAYVARSAKIRDHLGRHAKGFVGKPRFIEFGQREAVST